MSQQEPGVSVHAGFPNPATDQTIVSLDLQSLLVKHPASTFFMQIEGSQWEDMGIFDGDILLVDRALNPQKTDYIIWWQDDSFVISRFTNIPAETTLWGTVTTVIHRYHP